MSDNNNIIGNATKAIKDVSDACPIYEDMLQPAAKELGSALETTAELVNKAFDSIRALIWGYNKIKDYVIEEVSHRVAHVPPELIDKPSPVVAVPILNALRYTAQVPHLREMFANLLATAINKTTAPKAHPGYVEIIKQLTPDEAKIVALFQGKYRFPVLSVYQTAKTEIDGEKRTVSTIVFRHFSMLPYDAGCAHPEYGPSYLDNLCRLGLGEIPQPAFGGIATRTMKELYEPLLGHTTVVNAMNSIEETETVKRVIENRVFKITNFGQQFYDACVSNAPVVDLVDGSTVDAE